MMSLLVCFLSVQSTIDAIKTEPKALSVERFDMYKYFDGRRFVLL